MSTEVTLPIRCKVTFKFKCTKGHDLRLTLAAFKDQVSSKNSEVWEIFCVEIKSIKYYYFWDQKY